MPGLPRLALITTLLSIPLALDAAAQSQTGTGGGPGTTATAPNTSSVGRTKPPGGAGGPNASDESRRRTPQERADDSIQRGICIGCGAK